MEVDRVLEESHTVDPNTQEEVTHYLVKWRSLPYEDSTWELQQDVDPEKVKQFKIYRELPPEEERGVWHTEYYVYFIQQNYKINYYVSKTFSGSFCIHMS